MTNLTVPIIITVIGEGASGGALGIGIGDKIFMLQYSWYSVISPEGCAAILWRDNKYAPEAAEALKVTADDMWNLKLIDKIIPEPPGGAHNDYKLTAETIKKEILEALNELKDLPTDELIKKRIGKFRQMGVFKE